MKSFFLICAAFALCICSGIWQLRSQTTANATATVQFSNGDSITVSDFSNEIGVQPGEFLNVAVQLPPDAAGQPIVVEPLDGGVTSVGSSIRVVNDDGTFSFAFVAPDTTGIKSLGVWCGSNSFRLQFSVN